MLAPFSRPEATTLIVGVGGCGARTVAALTEDGDRALAGDEGSPVELVMVGTDARDVEASGASRRLLLGAETTRGKGTRGDPRLAREAALEERDRISDLVGSADLCLLTGGLGGGTGGGALPVVAERARRRGALTVAVVRTPAPHEGPRAAAQAAAALDALRPHVCVLVTIHGGDDPVVGQLSLQTHGPLGPRLPGPPEGDWPIGVRSAHQLAPAVGPALSVLTLHGCTVAVERAHEGADPVGPWLIRGTTPVGAVDAANQAKAAWEHLGLSGQACADYQVDARGRAWLLGLQALEAGASTPSWANDGGAAASKRTARTLSRRLGPLTRALLRALGRTAPPPVEHCLVSR
jgi:hypothetical protein